MNLVYALFAFALFASPIYSDATIPPAYANCSTLPLYGRNGAPSTDDINTLITENGWFEALLAAVVSTNSSAIEQSLYDPQDGTVRVTLTPTIGQPVAMTFPKKPFPSTAANCGGAYFSSSWVSAIYDGLTTIFENDNVSSTAGVGPRVSRGLNAIQATSGYSFNQSCLILPNTNTKSLYALAASVPVVAAVYPNTTDPQYANRMVAVTASDSHNSTVITANNVSFASMSVFGQPGISDLPWNEWSVDCEVLFWT
jgi:hypothetical protein